jgi:hypothetical protein
MTWEMKQWGLEVLLLILIAVCGYLLVMDVGNALQAQQHYHQMQRTTDYYTDLFTKHRLEQTNSVALPAPKPAN